MWVRKCWAGLGPTQRLAEEPSETHRRWDRPLRVPAPPLGLRHDVASRGSSRDRASGRVSSRGVAEESATLGALFTPRDARAFSLRVDPPPPPRGWSRGAGLVLVPVPLPRGMAHLRSEGESTSRDGEVAAAGGPRCPGRWDPAEPSLGPALHPALRRSVAHNKAARTGQSVGADAALFLLALPSLRRGEKILLLCCLFLKLCTFLLPQRPHTVREHPLR